MGCCRLGSILTAAYKKTGRNSTGCDRAEKKPRPGAFHHAIGAFCRVADGARTHDPQNHNLML